MDTYGQTLRTLRVDKGFTLQSLSEGIVSYSYLSKFEKGKSDITLVNLNALLQRLNVTLEEFMYFNDQLPATYVGLLNNVAIAYSTQNMEELLTYYSQEKDKYKETNSVFNRCNYIMIGAITQDLNPEFEIDGDDIQFYVDYIFSSTFWSTYEVSLLGNALHLFTYETLHLLIEEIKKKLDDFNVARRNVSDLLSVMQNASLILLREGHLDESEELLKYIEANLTPQDYFARNRIHFITSLIQIYRGKVSQGKEKAMKAIEVVDFIKGEPVQHYIDELDTVLENAKNK